MSLRFLLDTNLCVRLLRDRPQGLRERFLQNADVVCISTIIQYELLFGAEKSNKPTESRRDVERLTDLMAVLPFDRNAASHAADIRMALHRTGQIIGGIDLLIAGHARSLGLVVVSGNLHEFRRVDGLRCEDW